MSDTLESVQAYVDAFKQGAEYKYDEASGCMMVNAGGDIGWVQMTSPASLAGPTITGHTNSVGLYMEAVQLRALDSLNKLVNAVNAGACCRCAPTEVCPECHDLNVALAAAVKTIEELARPSDYTVQTLPANTPPAATSIMTVTGDSSRWATVSTTGTVSVSGGVLSIKGTS